MNVEITLSDDEIQKLIREKELSVSVKLCRNPDIPTTKDIQRIRDEVCGKIKRGRK